jgi:hypothetical protein
MFFCPSHRYSILNEHRVQIYEKIKGARGYGVECHFQQYLRYIVTVSVIGEENRSTRIKPPTCRKSLTNFIT